MMIAARDWLPTDALTDQTMQAALAAVVDIWSQRWAHQKGLTLKSLSLVSAQAARPMAQGHSGRIGEAVQMEWSVRHAQRLAHWALGEKPEGVVLSARDRAILNALGEEIAMDLVDRLARRFAVIVSDAGSPQDGDEIGLTLETRDWGSRLTAFLPAQALVAQRKALCTAQSRVQVVLSSAKPKVVDASVEFDVVLGRSDLSLRELRSIEPGDVLVLNSAIDKPIGIFASDDNTPVLGGQLQMTPTGASLTLCNAEAVHC